MTVVGAKFVATHADGRCRRRDRAGPGRAGERAVRRSLERRHGLAGQRRATSAATSCCTRSGCRPASPSARCSSTPPSRSSSTSCTPSCCLPLLGLGALLIGWFGDIQPWIDFNAAQQPLIEGGVTGSQWAHLFVSGLLWLVLPLALGLWRVLRAEVK